MDHNLLAQFGPINPPGFLANYGGGTATGIPILLNIILRTLIIAAGLFAVFNFLLAGMSYITAGGDPKKVQEAGNKILYSIIGLVVAAGTFVIAGVIGTLIFGNANALLQVTLYHP